MFAYCALNRRLFRRTIVETTQDNGAWIVEAQLGSWVHLRNEVLKRYVRMFLSGNCTVAQWNNLVDLYVGGASFQGRGAWLVYEKIETKTDRGSISEKRKIDFSVELGVKPDVLGRVFRRIDVEARLSKFKEQAELRRQEDHKDLVRKFLAKAASTESPCQLYRHFSSDGALLYVGIALNHVNRLSQHRNDSAWFPLIARIEIEHFESRTDAEQAERAAIKSERPIFNRTHNRFAYLVRQEAT